MYLQRIGESGVYFFDFHYLVSVWKNYVHNSIVFPRNNRSPIRQHVRIRGLEVFERCLGHIIGMSLRPPNSKSDCCIIETLVCVFKNLPGLLWIENSDWRTVILIQNQFEGIQFDISYMKIWHRSTYQTCCQRSSPVVKDKDIFGQRLNRENAFALKCVRFKMRSLLCGFFKFPATTLEENSLITSNLQ